MGTRLTNNAVGTYCTKYCCNKHFFVTSTIDALRSAKDRIFHFQHTKTLLLSFAIFILTFLFHPTSVVQAQGSNCTAGTPVFNIDLSDSADASWIPGSTISPNGQCCGAPTNHSCLELIVSLHPDASGISIVFTTPVDMAYYSVNCGTPTNITSNTVNLCFGDSGPHYISFCQQGTSAIAFEVFSVENVLEVTLEPFSPVCENSMGFMLHGGFPMGGVYYINGNPGLFFNVGEQGPGDHEITYEFTHPVTGCTGYATQTLTVVAMPDITWVTQEFCQSSGWAPLNGASPPGGIYSGSLVSGNHFNLNMAIPGNYPITYTYIDEFGCSSSSSGSVYVNENPLANAGPDQTIPGGTTATLQAADGGTGNYTYHWAPEHLFLNPWQQTITTQQINTSTIFTLTVTDNDTGCQSTDQVIVYVRDVPLHITTVTSTPDTICAGNETVLWVLPGGGSGIYTYYWTSSDAGDTDFPTTEPSPLVFPTQTTTYTIRIGDDNDPGLPTVTDSVTVQVNPLPDVTLDLPLPVCANTPGYALSGGLPLGGVYNILDTDGNILDLSYIDFSNFLPHDLGEGDYQVMYTYTDPFTGCTNSAVQPFTILPFVKAVFYTHREDICLSGEISIANHSIGASQYGWNFGDGTTSDEGAASFMHIFPDSDNIETYTITLTAHNLEECTNVQSRNVKVFPPVTADFTYTPQEGCSDLEVQFTNNSDGPIIFHLWDFGDGTFTTQQSPTHTYTNLSDNDTIFWVTLSVMSANYFCTDSRTFPVTVYPAINAAFTSTPVEGCHPLSVEFGNISTGATQYFWDFGNGETYDGENPGHIVFENTTTEIQEYIIRLEIQNEHCNDNYTDTIRVFPAVTAAFSASDTLGCSPLEVNFEFLFGDTTAYNATHFSWDFGDNASSSLQNPVHIFENNTSDTIIYTVWLRVRTDNFCKDSVSQDIIVLPYLEAGFDFNPAQACNPAEITFFNTSYGAHTYHWDMDDGTTYDHSDEEFIHIFDHDDPDPVEYNVQLQITNEQGCTNLLQRKVTIYPKIEALFTPSVVEGCNPLTVEFTNESTGYQNVLWEFGDNGSSVEVSPVHVFENTSFTNDTVFTVWLYTQSAYHCRDSIYATITVFPKVKADFVVGINQGCSPFPVTIENLTQGEETLFWSFGDGNSSTSADDILTHVFVNTSDTVQIFEIELLATSHRGCTDTLRRQITVFPEVNAGFDHLAEGCHPLVVNFENLTENAHYYHWDFGNSITVDQYSPTHTFLNQSHYNQAVFEVELYASSVHGCFDMAFSTVVVDPKPDASFLITNSPGCSPHEVMILHNSQGGTSFLWDFDDSSPLESFDQDTIYHLYNHPPGDGPGFFNISLTTENDFGCLDTLVQQAVIYPSILAQMDASVVEGCHPLTVEFTNSSEGATATNAYFWNYGNGFTSHSQLPMHSHTFNNFSHTRDTIFTVLLTAYNENGCLDTTSIDIRVFPRPRAFFSVPNTPGCAPHDAIIHNFSIGADEYLWDMGDGTTFTHGQAHFTHGYTQPASEGPGIFTITLDVDNDYGCEQSHSQNIVIYPEINPVFVTDNEGCHPHTAFFENLSEGGDIILWTFGNGNFSQENHPQQTYTNYSHTESLTYNVKLQVESTWGCSAQTTQEVTVWPVPKALFELSPFTGCSPFTPLVSNLSVGGTGFRWDLGNAELETSEASFYHTWTNPTEDPMQYPISLTVWNDFGCVASNNQVTSVYPEVVAFFSTENEIWQGCSPLTIKFVNESTLSENYKWNFADDNTSTSASPEHIFVNENIYDHIFPVQLVAGSIYGCKDTIVRDITVFPSPIADFIAQPDKQPYPNTTVTFTNRSNIGFWNFHWEFGDENNHQTTSPLPFDHTYVWDEHDMSTKEYVVALQAFSENCSDMVTRNVIITSPIPKADFNSLNAGCAPFTVQFSNESMYAHSFRWEFGDGGYSVDPAPEHTFIDPGTYEVLLVAIGDGGRDTTYHLVEVHENPTALFELVSTHISIPEEPLRVINNSILADFYFWEFGDGGTSFDFEPEHYYTEPGIYSVTLVATRNTMPLCHDTLVMKNAPRVDETCKIVFPDAFMPELSGSPGGSFEMNNPSTTIFHPVWEGVKDYTLEIYNRWGELIFRSNDINEGWDGYLKGKPAKMDVYVWKVTGRCTNGRSIIMAGDVTLYR